MPVTNRLQRQIPGQPPVDFGGAPQPIPQSDFSQGQPPFGDPRGPSPEQMQMFQQQEMMRQQGGPAGQAGGQHPLFGGQPQSQQPPPQAGGRSPYDDESGAGNGLDTDYLMSMLNNTVLPELSKRYGSNLDRGQGVNDKLRGFYENAGLDDRLASIDNSLMTRTQRSPQTKFSDRYFQGDKALAGALDDSEGVLSGLYGSLKTINSKGLPGQRQMESETGQLGLGGMAGDLLGGKGNYGVNDLLSQILSKGVTNQDVAEDITRDQSEYGKGKLSQGDQALSYLRSSGLTSPAAEQGQQLFDRPVQTKTPASTGRIGGIGDKLLETEYDVKADPLAGKAAARTEEALGKGGLTDEYVSASRNKILKPSTEALYERLNRQGGGVSSLSSGLMAELDRRNEADFNDSLVMAGYKGYNDLLDKGFDYGTDTYEQGYGNKKLGLESKKLGTDLAGRQAGLETDIALADPKYELDSYKLGGDLLGEEYGRGFDTAKLYGDRGERALDRSLSGFESVADSAYPYIKMAGDLGTKYLDQSQGRFDSTSKYGLDALDLMGKWGSYPMDQALDYGLKERGAEQAERGLDVDERGLDIKENQFDTNTRMQLLDMLLGGEQKYLTGEEAAGQGQNQQLVDMLSAALAGEYQGKNNPWWKGLI